MSKARKVPTQEEIEKLPRFAAVAFAARCARRVQPLFIAGWPDAPRQHIDAVDRAITVAERSAAGAPGGAYAAAAAAATAGAAAATAARAARAAMHAADAAVRAADAVYDPALAVAVVAAAVDAVAARAARAAVTAARAAIRQDFEQLLSAAERDEWTYDTPVPPEFFGPLWPEGEPKGWPTTTGPTQPGIEPLTLLIDPGTASPEEIGELLAEISALYRMLGGSGINFTLTDVRSSVEALV
jgi:hypothetical protein